MTDTPPPDGRDPGTGRFTGATLVAPAAPATAYHVAIDVIGDARPRTVRMRQRPPAQDARRICRRTRPSSFEHDGLASVVTDKAQ